jgi:hypothetical protein
VESLEGDFLEKETTLFREARKIDDQLEPVLMQAGNDPGGFQP